jgi:hypothetical protein
VYSQDPDNPADCNNELIGILLENPLIGRSWKKKLG